MEQERVFEEALKWFRQGDGKTSFTLLERIFFQPSESIAHLRPICRILLFWLLVGLGQGLIYLFQSPFQMKYVGRISVKNVRLRRKLWLALFVHTQYVVQRMKPTFDTKTSARDRTSGYCSSYRFLSASLSFLCPSKTPLSTTSKHIRKSSGS